MSKIVVIDYGMGNTLSVCRALEHVGANEVILSDKIEDLESADALVLPGVGAFGDGMAELHKRNLVETIQNEVDDGTPLLGICLGAQMLVDSSDEFGNHNGLGLIAGKVKAVPDLDYYGEDLKIPHMGWANLKNIRIGKFDNPLLTHIEPESAVYFVHSFQIQTDDVDDLTATCQYGGNQLTAMISHDNIYGCQFHPEKSGPIGLTILQDFVELVA